MKVFFISLSCNSLREQYLVLMEAWDVPTFLYQHFEEMPLCTHVVCVQPLKRTVKLCAAISLPSVTLVTSDWIKACESAKSFVDPKPYTLSGVQCHGKAWEFNVSASLENRQKKKHGCLHGQSFFITPNNKPASRMPDSDLQMVIRCAGGEVQEKPPNSSNEGKVIVVSTEEERTAWSKYAKYAKAVMEAGHLLTCVLKQEVAKGGKLE